MGAILNQDRVTHKIFSLSVLILLIIFVVSKHLDLHRPPTANNPLSHQWLQPTELNAQYPQLISERHWALDFTQIEHIINNLESDSNHRLLINSDLNDKLPQILLALDDTPSQTQWQRLHFLINKSLGDNMGNELYTLLTKYYLYQQQVTQYAHQIQQSNAQQKRVLLSNHHQLHINLQSHYFGADTASKLFNKKNKVAHYLNSIRIINMDDSLTNQQKKEQLALLSKHYKQSLIQR